jgi:hypothetical protein
MNSSLLTADGATHLKAVVIALLAAVIVVWIGMTARVATDSASSAGRRIEMPMPKPDIPVPPGSAKAGVV